jgi:ATP-dependent Clp protease ATP-binding subunit ClpA
MPDYLSPKAQEALDLAKRAVPAGAPLTPELLMAAAYRQGKLEEKAPQLARYLPAPEPLDDKAPGPVTLAEGLQPVFGQLSQRHDVSVNELLKAVIDSPAGREFLRTKGLPDAEIDEVVAALAAVDDEDWPTSPQRRKAIEALAPFGRMLTVGEPPKKGVMRMDRYVKALQKNLLKMRRPSVIVIGQPGTGKTALVFEFARMIIEKDPAIVPRLRDRDVFELSPSFLRAGASMVGQYEERVSTLLKVLEANPKIILFVDEVHSLLSSGMHERGPFSDANESFKTAVGRGGISLIGATTLAEYRHYIAPDGALARRFGLIKIDPPDPDETLAILKGRASQYRRHYAPLDIPDAILEETVQITEDLLPERFQPDKSLDLLDEACAVATMTTPPLVAVTEEALLQSVEDALGHSVVKPGTLQEDEVLEELKKVIVGQDEAMAAVARGFVAGMSKDWLQHKGPRRIFFFCGPTGVGKTESARILARKLGGGRREAMLRIDCNTLQGSGAEDAGPILNRLLGVPPGYIGYARGEGGMLSKIRDTPECIVLFDEIEKASPAISQVLLQVLDEGRVEDTDGNPLDFRRAFVIFTTNAGTEYGPKRSGYDSTGIGFDRTLVPSASTASTASTAPATSDRAGGPVPRVSVEAVKADLLRRGYGEEFFGRQIDFIVFDAMEREDVEVVLRRQLGELQDEAGLRGYTLSCDEGVVDHLLDEWTPRFGGRWAYNILRTRIVEQLALADAQGELNGVTKIHVVKRPAVAQKEGEPESAGLASRLVEGDTMTVLVS